MCRNGIRAVYLGQMQLSTDLASAIVQVVPVYAVGLVLASRSEVNAVMALMRRLNEEHSAELRKLQAAERAQIAKYGGTKKPAARTGREIDKARV
jgi:hypothetical protein